MRTAEEIERKIDALGDSKMRAYDGDWDIEGIAAVESAIMALRWVLGNDNFDI
jgi:hypothetical protein